MPQEISTSQLKSHEDITKSNNKPLTKIITMQAINKSIDELDPFITSVFKVDGRYENGKMDGYAVELYFETSHSSR